jgi:hypothetical protein
MPYKVTRCVMLAGFSCSDVCVPTILNVLVASTSSCRVAAVILEESTKSFMALDGPLTLRAPGRRHENAIPLALVGALRMIMRHVFHERMSQGAFTKQDQLGQRFLSLVGLSALGVWDIACGNARRGARIGGCVTAYKKVSSNNLTKREPAFYGLCAPGQECWRCFSHCLSQLYDYKVGSAGLKDVVGTGPLHLGGVNFDTTIR